MNPAYAETVIMGSSRSASDFIDDSEDDNACNAGVDHENEARELDNDADNPIDILFSSIPNMDLELSQDMRFYVNIDGILPGNLFSSAKSLELAYTPDPAPIIPDTAIAQMATSLSPLLITPVKECLVSNSESIDQKPKQNMKEKEARRFSSRIAALAVQTPRQSPRLAKKALAKSNNAAKATTKRSTKPKSALKPRRLKGPAVSSKPKRSKMQTIKKVDLKPCRPALDPAKLKAMMKNSAAKRQALEH